MVILYDPGLSNEILFHKIHDILSRKCHLVIAVAPFARKGHWRKMNDKNVVIPLKRFLLVEQPPASWKGLDLYLFRDENVVFYVGQSYLAFDRVWKHLLSGFKGHSIIGRFVWCNWPKSMGFTIELLSSHSEQFD